MFRGHEIGAAMTCDDDCAAGIPHTRRRVPVPAFEIAVKKAAGKGIARAKHVLHLDGKRRGFYSFAALYICLLYTSDAADE